MPIIKVMGEPLVITSNDSILATLDFKPYRSKVERRVIPFLPGPDEPQTMEINIPRGAQLTARKGDFLVSEVDTPNDYWSVDPVIFEESYEIVRPGYCVKKAVTLLVPLTDRYYEGRSGPVGDRRQPGRGGDGEGRGFLACKRHQG